MKRIFITPGEPAGIGPDLTIMIAQLNFPAELVVVADPDLLESRAKRLNLPLHLKTISLEAPPAPHAKSTLNIIPVTAPAQTIPGQLNPANATYVLKCLEIAATHCLEKQGHALVTGPVHKGVINEAGIAFTGHTEFLAKRCHAPHVVMLFVTPSMKVATATSHLPLNQVANHLTGPLIQKTLQVLRQGLIDYFNCFDPVILVAGLNPHAGEQGHLGREEIEIITPALNQLRHAGLKCIGPLPADTLFTEKTLKTGDAVLAMYHDQALPVVKYSAFDQAVNVTLGLPIIRTSVDHGTALDIAGTTQAETGSLATAIHLAIKMSKARE